MKSFYDELQERYPAHVVIVKIWGDYVNVTGTHWWYVVHNEDADIVSKALGYQIYNDGAFGRAAAGPDVDKIIGVLADKGYGFIVWANDKVERIYTPKEVKAHLSKFLPDDVVKVNSCIDIDMDGDIEHFKIVETKDGIKDNVYDAILFDAPIAQALVGHHAGETVSVNAPAGKYDVKIVKIDNT